MPRSRTPTPYRSAIFRQTLDLKCVDDLVGGGDRFVDLRRDRDHALTVLAADTRKAGLLVEADHFGERHLDPCGASHIAAAEIGFGEGVMRQAYANGDFLVSPRKALGDDALEGGANLAGGALGRKAESAAAWAHREDRLPLAVGRVVFDIAYAWEAAEQREDLACRPLECPHIVARDPDVDLAAGRSRLALEDRHGLEARQRAYTAAPRLDQRRGANGALIGGPQLHPHAADVIAGTEEESVGASRRLADLTEAHGHETARATGQLRLGLIERPF